MVFTMTLTIPDDYVESARVSESELYVELAVRLFQMDRLTLAQAATLSRMGRVRFQQLLASRGISTHYDLKEFEDDLDTLRRLERI